MPVFVYQGKNRAGTKVTGEQTANNKAELAALLRRQQINVTKMSEKGKEFVMPSFGRRQIRNEIAIFTRQFSVMIDAGLPLVQCLEILGGQQENKTFQKVLLGTRAAVEGGPRFPRPCASTRRFSTTCTSTWWRPAKRAVFSTPFFSGFRLHRKERQAEARGEVRVGLSDRCFVAASVITLLLWKVVPIFTTLFVSLGVDLPLPTRIVIGLSHFVGSIFGFLTLVAAVGGVIGLKVWYGTEEGRMVIDTVVLKLPVIGILMRKIAVARFTRTLGTLIASGVPILEGLDITARSAGNAVVERALQNVRRSLEAGRTLAEPLKETDVFPGMVTQMISVGEQTGAMDAMLQKIADFYEDEVDAAVKDLLAAMEPIMIVVFGVVVGGIVISMYMPLFSLIGKLSGK